MAEEQLAGTNQEVMSSEKQRANWRDVWDAWLQGAQGRQGQERPRVGFGVVAEQGGRVVKVSRVFMRRGQEQMWVCAPCPSPPLPSPQAVGWELGFARKSCTGLGGSKPQWAETKHVGGSQDPGSGIGCLWARAGCEPRVWGVSGWHRPGDSERQVAIPCMWHPTCSPGTSQSCPLGGQS